MHGREIELGGECSDQSPIGALRGNGDNQLRAASLRIPVWIADDLVVGSEGRLPIVGKSNVADIARAGRNDIAVEVEDRQLLEVAEALVEREQVVAKAAFRLGSGYRTRRTIKRVGNFI